MLKGLDLSVNEFNAIVQSYFNSCDSKSPCLQYTLTGLAIHLGWKVRDILSFEKTSPFYPIIEHAMLLCEDNLIKNMASGKFDKAVGEILLVNHFGYVKKIEEPKSPKGGDKEKKTISQLLDDLELNKKTL